jgi:Sigma-70, region 4
MRSLTLHPERDMGHAMTFSAIGRELGMSRNAAMKVYRRAIAKLRETKPETLAIMHELANELEHSRQLRKAGHHD